MLLAVGPTVRTPIAIAPVPGRRCPPVATALGRWSLWAPRIRGSSGRSGSGVNRSSPTGRGHLGIHLDPRANRNANSGTLGCVGLIRWEDMQTLAGLVQRRNVRTLVVSE